ncbi:uncharacterized protein UV8b_03542 [Ustilaginoidea virens]|uniref:Uncharacterized protein n=1 Tax=Ustilaginoidea virens TaxID=1159556 RepID=A0A8E5HPP1_USTVR|nr:uncharacterized protein UV8b_03542 [Ustilaginoidea virens]QUC19301.1 hypothetical protein UV8b_03542 [Ustilaginoidea virens]
MHRCRDSLFLQSHRYRARSGILVDADESRRRRGNDEKHLPGRLEPRLVWVHTASTLGQRHGADTGTALATALATGRPTCHALVPLASTVLPARMSHESRLPPKTLLLPAPVVVNASLLSS